MPGSPEAIPERPPFRWFPFLSGSVFLVLATFGLGQSVEVTWFRNVPPPTLFFILRTVAAGAAVLGLAVYFLWKQVREVRHVNASFQGITSAAPDAILITDRQGVISYGNRAAGHLFGIERTDLIGRSVTSLLPERFREIYSRAMRSPADRRLELFVLRETDGEIPVEVSLSRWRTPEGEFFTAILRDVTERMLAERQIRTKERTLREVSEHLRREAEWMRFLRDLAVSTNEVGSVEEALETALEGICELTSWAIGHAWLTAEGDPARIEPTAVWVSRVPGLERPLRAVPADEDPGIPERARSLSRALWALDCSTMSGVRPEAASGAGLVTWLAFPILVRRDTVGVLEFFSTSREEPDEQLLELMIQAGAQLGRVIERRHVERMRQNLEMLSHDLKMPLSAILGFVQLYQEDGEEAVPLGNLLDRVEANASDALMLASNFVDAARIEHRAPTLVPEAVAINDLVSNVIRQQESLARVRDVRVDSDLAPGLPALLLDRHLAERVVANLLGNAIKVSGAGSCVRVTTGRESDRIEIRISDEGPGIPPERRERLFERYGSSRSGAGLGLYIVKTIVELLGGDVRAEPGPERGTTFRVSFPLREKSSLRSVA